MSLLSRLNLEKVSELFPGIKKTVCNHEVSVKRGYTVDLSGRPVGSSSHFIKNETSSNSLSSITR